MTKRLSNPPRNSHVIPARLLAQFGLPLGIADQVDYRRLLIQRYSLSGEAAPLRVESLVHRDFYSYPEADGSRNNEHEARMNGQIEGPFNKLLPLFDLSVYVPNREDGAVIARYVANLFQRGHQRRHASLAQQAETGRLAKLLVEDPHKLRQLAAAYSVLTRRPIKLAEVVRGTASLYIGDEKSRDAFFLRNLEHHEETLFNILKGQPYGVLRAPKGTEFVMSDTAVLTRLPIGPGAFSIGEGFTKANVHTLLPVSPQTCLQIGIPNNIDVTLHPHQVLAINVDSIRLMNRWVYARSTSPVIETWIKSFGGTVKYRTHAFRTRELSADDMLDLLVSNVLDELFYGKSEAVARLRRMSLALAGSAVRRSA